MSLELDQFRRDYLKGGLRRADMPAEPFSLFHAWQQQSLESPLADPTAMVLASCDSEGQPSQRIVLLKKFDENGFVFFTNYGSRKGRELQANPRVSLLFPWNLLERQVKVYGRAELTSAEISDRYFASRPRDSQLGAWASRQSSVLQERAELEQAFARRQQEFAGREVPRPNHWGGVRVVPHKIEFWQGGADRLHDRFLYTLQADGSWSLERLAP